MQLRQRSVAQLGCFVRISFALGAVSCLTRFFQLRFQIIDLLDHAALALPLRFERADLLLQLCDFAVDRFQTIFRRRILFFRQRLLLDLQLRHAPLKPIDLLGHRSQLDA